MVHNVPGSTWTSRHTGFVEEVPRRHQCSRVTHHVRIIPHGGGQRVGDPVVILISHDLKIERLRNKQRREIHRHVPLLVSYGVRTPKSPNLRDQPPGT
jgi:hypothetical protein